MTEGDLLIRGVRQAEWQADSVDGRIAAGPECDLRLRAGWITEVAPVLDATGDEAVLDGHGAVVLPGLHDHHLHLRSALAAEHSVRVGPADVIGRHGLAAALRSAPADARGWRRAVGYHQSVAGDIDRHALDELVPGIAVRVQHRSGAMWVLSSPAIEALGLDHVDAAGVERDPQGFPTGRLMRMDRWLAERLAGEDPTAQVASWSSRLAARGVTGLTDATPGATTAAVAALAAAVSEGRLLQRVHVMCPTDTGVPAHPLISRGPDKVLLHDDALPSLDDLVDVVRDDHGAGSPVAIHCVTAAQLALSLAALTAAGAWAEDRIEHGSVIFDEHLSTLVELGVTVVTNPAFVTERGDGYLEEVDRRDQPHLYRCGTLLEAGIPTAAGTDAPFGTADPWATVAAARTRHTGGGQVLGAGECVTLPVALSLFYGHPRQPGQPRSVVPGEPGDLVLLADGVVPEPGDGSEALATVVAGNVVHHAG